MKRLLLILGLSLASAVSAASLEQARLVDWYYPGEPAYQWLKQAVLESKAQGFVADRLGKGEKIPQASARELALDLSGNTVVAVATRQALTGYFKDEAEALRPAEEGIKDLELRLERLNAQMDSLEVANKSNVYGSYSLPRLTHKFQTAWLQPGGGGLLTGRSSGFFLQRYNLSLTSEQPTFYLGLIAGIGRGENEDNDPNRPARNDYNFQRFGLGWTVNRWGGWSFRLGGNETINTSTFVGSVEQGTQPKGNFYLDLEAGERPLYTQAELTMDLPSGPGTLDNAVSLRGLGATTWWPFAETIIFYNQPDRLYATFNNRAVHSGVGVRWEGGPFLGLLRSQSIKGAVTYYGNDGDRVNVLAVPDQTRARESVLAGAVGWDARLPWNVELQSEWAQSHNSALYNLPLTLTSGVLVQGLDRHYEDQALVVNVRRPFGFMNLGLEYSQLGPFFLAAPVAIGASGTFFANGVEGASANSLTPWSGAPRPGGTVSAGRGYSLNDASDVAWGSDIGNSTRLMSNNRKAVLKSQASWAWISGLFFAGSSVQDRPSAAWVKTSPSLESGDNGRLLYDNFSGTYYSPPAPFAAAPSPSVGGAAYQSTDPSYYQWAFNRPADGVAVVDNVGNTRAVHWQAISQTGYHRLDLNVLMTRGGLGDPRLAADSVKYMNYATARLKFNLQEALRLRRALELQVRGEIKELAPELRWPRSGEPGLPSSDPSASFLAQSMVAADLRVGLNDWFQMLATAGHEAWRSDHGYLPLHIEVRMAGVGADVDASTLLSGFGVFWRSRILYLEDYNIGARALSAWESSVGCSLSF